MFSSRSFIVSGLTFRSLIHFQFIFVYGVRKCSSFILLQVVDQFSQHHLFKEVVFFPLYILASFVEDKVTIRSCIYLWAFYSVPLIYISVLSKRLLNSWLQSPSSVILEPNKIKPVPVSIVSPSICHEVMELDAMISVF